MAYSQGKKRNTPADIAALSPQRQAQKSRNYMLWALGRQMMTEKELRTRLTRKGYDPQIIDEAINDFIDSGLINDEVYLDAYMARGATEQMGNNGVKRKLLEKGIAEDRIDAYLDERPTEDEHERAYELASRKSSAYPSNLPYQKRMNRLVGLLSRKGFSGDVVFNVARRVTEEDHQDEGDDL